MYTEKVLRYLSRQKFEWLLSDEGIYVGAARDQSDQDEGKFDHTLISQALKRHPDANFPEEMWAELDRLSHGMMENNRETKFLSSWYLGDHEKFEMWSEYADDGVVIVSETAILRLALPDPIKHAADFGEVVYDDVKKVVSVNDPLMHKNEKFLPEKEFRLIFDAKKYSMLTGYDKERFDIAYIGDKPSYESDEFVRCMSQESRKNAFSVIERKNMGYVIKYDLGRLIQEIRVNPNISGAQIEEVRSACSGAGLSVPVSASKLTHN